MVSFSPESGRSTATQGGLEVSDWLTAGVELNAGDDLVWAAVTLTLATMLVTLV